MKANIAKLFWRNPDREVRPRAAIEYIAPPIPDTGWRPPSEFPRLEAAKVLAIDCETKDPNLLERGPGGIRRDGHIVGISVGTEDGGRWYFPMRHEVGGMNMDAEQVLRWAADELTRPRQTKIGANLLYDAEWLASEGVDITTGDPKFIDVQWQEALLDENAKSYALETLAQKYLGEGKHSNALYEWCAQAYGGAADSKQRANIYRAPASLAGPYAESDCDLPLRIARMQQALLESEALCGVADLEHALIPMLLAMRRRGVRVDADGAQRLDEQWGHDIETIRGRYGVDPWNAADIARECALLNLPFNKTAAGAPSFTKEWLAIQKHPLLRDIARARKLDKARGTFIKGHILSHLVDGRIHIAFNPLRKDDGGTVSGRFSSTHHNMPKRDEEIGTLIRALFLPEDGEDWVRLDYSQIEPRLQFHAASGPQAAAMRARLAANPSLNCYRLMMLDMAGLDKDHDAFYSTFKGIWLGISYEMGLPSMAAHLGVTTEQARAWREAFPPYITDLSERAKRRAERAGYITTLLGRRARFPLWESRNWEQSRADGAMEEAAAHAKYGNGIRRAYTHKALNRYAQGSAADIMKKAMADIWKSGACRVLGPPSFTIHDELDFSVPRTPEAHAALDAVQHIMEHCVTLRVPLRAEREEGPSWGQLEAVK
jgi:DNA polymerase I-like protein with 3'-5' exonuclease and polymerase domains